MHNQVGRPGRPALCLLVGIATGALLVFGCAGGSFSYYQTVLGHTPFSTYTGSSDEPAADGDGSSFFDSGSRTNVNPCSEPNARKFIRISMRNLDPDDYIHYFLVLIAYVNSDTYPTGAVCPDDVDLYTSFGYQAIPAGVEQEFGNLCVQGPALLYFHFSGQFRRSGGVGGAQLASAIAPAQGTNATYDNFFTSGGATVPIPDRIYFHNPGTGEGAALHISWSSSSPCSEAGADLLVDSDCDQDSFYYVDESDLISGSIELGVGSGRRVPSEIQDTGCECTGFQQPYQSLAPSGTGASNALCYEFLRGGRIEYVFVRDDTNPPFPQLLWRVTDQSGAEVHNFDSRGPLP
jgi:hypothetical protein